MGQPHNQKRTRSRPRTRRPALYSNISTFSYPRHYSAHVPTHIYPDDIKKQHSNHLAAMPDTLLHPSIRDRTIISPESSLDTRVASLSSQSWPESVPDLSDCSSHSSRSSSLERLPTPSPDLPQFPPKQHQDLCPSASMWQPRDDFEHSAPEHTSASSTHSHAPPMSGSSGSRPRPLNEPTPTHHSFIDCPLALTQFPPLPTPASARHRPLASSQPTSRPHSLTSSSSERPPSTPINSPPLRPRIISYQPPLPPPFLPSPLRQVQPPPTPCPSPPTTSSPPPTSSRPTTSSPPPSSSSQTPSIQNTASQLLPSQVPASQVPVLSKRQQRKLSGDQSEARAAKRRRIFGFDEGDEAGELGERVLGRSGRSGRSGKGGKSSWKSQRRTGDSGALRSEGTGMRNRDVDQDGAWCLSRIRIWIRSDVEGGKRAGASKSSHEAFRIQGHHFTHLTGAIHVHGWVPSTSLRGHHYTHLGGASMYRRCNSAP
ncbi:hypothetical protein BDZ85DRAFT_63737 [Elsinoe ampelina]|uniref:Uncharacterized protein n=1 Tax=Elsinoe ampelina TaxID=302913 RepID=A0A6A6FZE7_9PEZI|nr:hypothetical protein BDZ85DRAFT_63737 [Elsinoe ampelina]